MLTFSPSSHTYYWHDMPVPSVTKIRDAAGLGADYSYVDPELLAAAADRGTAVHELVATMDACTGSRLYEQHVALIEAVPPELRTYGRAYLAFLRDSGYRPLDAEVMLYSETYGFAGCRDKRGWLGRKRVIIDAKTPIAIDKPGTAIQLAAYQQLEAERAPLEIIHACYALQLGADNRYKLIHLPTEHAWRVFVAALRQYAGTNTGVDQAIMIDWLKDNRPARRDHGHCSSTTLRARVGG